MDILVQLLATGAAIGSIYALVALGMIIIYRAANVVNFAQGDFAMAGAFAISVLTLNLHVPFWVAFMAAVIILAVMGILFELGVYYPLRNRSFLPVIISTIGASIFMQNLALYIFGPSPRQAGTPFTATVVDLLGVKIGPQYLLVIAVTAILVVVQYFFFEKTLLGKKLQATAQDKETARLLGIPINLMIAITFVNSSIVGGVAGVLVAPIIYVTAGMGVMISLKAFAACIIGGFGSISGAIIGGLGLGIIEALGAGYISASYRDAFAFILLILILLFRPQGIFGEKVSEKA
ncbi:branched-chain amino acid ABC transporter permease [Paradesulfitobacterium aromaticivorans]